MPHKQNPINFENICSLADELPKNIFSAWQNSAYVWFERTLRDSAGKRSWLPEAFLTVDEILDRGERVISGLRVHEKAIATNFRKFAPFMATEALLAELVEAGMDRQGAHDLMVEIAEDAVEAVREGKPNSMKRLVLSNTLVWYYLDRKKINKAFAEVGKHVGRASAMTDRLMQEKIKPLLEAA